ncbi:heme-binding protein [Methylomarinum sp. Ch1-1]|uniref:Heme-binding protein n=1 Tax=Methylomarinum roseum TaxID=3067653 RepID=A0AAU7NWP0_9GAMM|nr:heme-binding protein [Methylomarinum sp. Ch1-1]MDP4522924.1 heme-binding protein [Methylomarinum sp. Ch1-1]
MKKTSLALTVTLALGAGNAFADCNAIADAATNAGDNLHAKLSSAIAGTPSAAGLKFNMWATIVDNNGIVCAVANTGEAPNAQWLGSRVISAQKANTANLFSLTQGLALSTANLWAATQPGGSLFGLQFSNPVNTDAAYGPAASVADYGSSSDPMVDQLIGGVNVFGGGLALYDSDGNQLGAIGMSGDTSCADHIKAWIARDALGLDHVPAGVANGTDNIIFDIQSNSDLTNKGGKTVLNQDNLAELTSASGFGHPTCGFGEETIAVDLPNSYPIGD